jgi:DNA replication protein DnaC
VAVARGNEKGRVERSIRYIRDNFFAAGVYTDVADLNAQAKAWTDGPAFSRPWPEGEQLTVRQAFETETASLMTLPIDAYPVDVRVEVQVAKTPYVRFDLNDYSIPHTHVRRTVTVLANAERVRVLDGVTVLAEHARSYDKGEQVEITAHVDALIERKRGARQHRGISQLTQAIPAMADFLARAATKGHHLASMADFEWDWPTRCDRQAVQELMTLSFMADGSNVMLVGPNGVGQSMLACNLGHQALIQGHTVLFITAGQLLGDLAALDSDSALRRRLKHYAAPDLLLVDEVGYLSYPNRHVDLLFELISRRHEQKSPVITTNRAFKEWYEVFSNAACVVSLIDRLVHRCEIVPIEGETYRLKEAMARPVTGRKYEAPWCRGQAST